MCFIHPPHSLLLDKTPHCFHRVLERLTDPALDRSDTPDTHFYPVQDLQSLAQIPVRCVEPSTQISDGRLRPRPETPFRHFSRPVSACPPAATWASQRMTPVFSNDRSDRRDLAHLMPLRLWIISQQQAAAL